MNNFIKEISDNILSLHRYSKRAIAIVTDLALCILCTWLAFILRLEELILFKDFNFYPALISVCIALPIFWLFGLYRTIFRYTNLSIILNILKKFQTLLFLLTVIQNEQSLLLLIWLYVFYVRGLLFL